MARPAKAGKSFKKTTEKMNVLHKKERAHQKTAVELDFAKKIKIPRTGPERAAQGDKSYFSSFSQASAAPSRNCPP